MRSHRPYLENMSRKSDEFSVALAQLNPVVGDLEGNLKRARKALRKARELNADLVVLPELFLAGYPLEDLARSAGVADAVAKTARRLAKETADGSPAVLVGAPWRKGERLLNAALLLRDGDVAEVRAKTRLPNYGPFDEKRIFDPDDVPQEPIEIEGVLVGAPLCEDAWISDPCRELKAKGAEFFAVMNGSPYSRGHAERRMDALRARVAENNAPFVYVNQVGGQDELVFDGRSFVLDAEGRLALALPAWREDVVVSRWRRRADRTWTPLNDVENVVEASDSDGLRDDWLACVAGTRDYVRKSGFERVVLGLSGGVDSALVAALAVDALGADNVLAATMPYLHTSPESLADAEETARRLGIELRTIPLASAADGLLAALKAADVLLADAALENLQARARGTILMGLANAQERLLLSTGNKSEMSVGYATLYGDMNGAFNPIKDVYKTRVYALARMRNAQRPEGCLGKVGEIIPPRVLSKPPSAELRPDQRDDDSLPPYDVLDPILKALVEDDLDDASIVALGIDPDLVERTRSLLLASEHKRRQAPPGPRLTLRHLARDRRMPIVNRWRGRP